MKDGAGVSAGPDVLQEVRDCPWRFVGIKLDDDVAGTRGNFDQGASSATATIGMKAASTSTYLRRELANIWCQIVEIKSSWVWRRDSERAAQQTHH